MAPEIGEQVVVLTGASSGIGRDTALEFARRGAKVVLAARNREALDTLVGEVERLGGVAVAVATDISDYRQLTELASRAVERFGRIDTWVNNASVSTYGTVEQMDVEEIRPCSRRVGRPMTRPPPADQGQTNGAAPAPGSWRPGDRGLDRFRGRLHRRKD